MAQIWSIIRAIFSFSPSKDTLTNETLSNKRLELAFGWAGLVYTVVFVGLIVYFQISSTWQILPLFGTDANTDSDFQWFIEWEESVTPPVGDIRQEFSDASNLFITAAVKVFFESGHHIAGITRNFCVLTVAIASFCTYRRYLFARYILENQRAQLEDFLKLIRTPLQFWISRILFTTAAMIGAYIISSIFLFLLSFILKDFSSHAFWVAVDTSIFCCICVGITVYWISVIDTQNMLLLGLITWIGGLTLSFAITDINRDAVNRADYWWCQSISNVAHEMPSAPIFIASFLCLIIVLYVLLFDLSSIVLLYAEVHKQLSGWFKRELLRGQLFVIAATLTTIGLALATVVRTNGFGFNEIAHTGGIFLASAVILLVAWAMVWANRYGKIFHRYYNIFIFFSTIITVVVWILSLPLFESSSECKGGFVNLTTFELVSLGLIGIMAYVVLHNFLQYANDILSKDATTTGEDAG